MAYYPAGSVTGLACLTEEAPKETFPASDPIAINVEHESPEYENGHNAGFPDPFSSTRKAPRRR